MVGGSSCCSFRWSLTISEFVIILVNFLTIGGKNAMIDEIRNFSSSEMKGICWSGEELRRIMNIFYLDDNPEICAKYHVDKHVVKMILEYAQLLSTAHRLVDRQFFEDGCVKFGWDEVLYKSTHVNHPSSLWVRHSSSNYQWLYALWLNLLREYTYRYGKVHKSSRLWEVLGQSPISIKDSEFTEPPLVMPEVYHSTCAVTAYREYYRKEKTSLLTWKNREAPEWAVIC